MKEWEVFIRNVAGTVELPSVVGIDSESVELRRTGFAPPIYGGRIRVRVTKYVGPDDLSGMLVFRGQECGSAVVFGATLVRITEVTIGVTELTFEAPSQDNINSPILFRSWASAQKQLSGPMPDPDNMNV